MSILSNIFPEVNYYLISNKMEKAVNHAITTLKGGFPWN
jgi:hypothetical protein